MSTIPFSLRNGKYSASHVLTINVHSSLYIHWGGVEAVTKFWVESADFQRSVATRRFHTSRSVEFGLLLLGFRAILDLIRRRVLLHR